MPIHSYRRNHHRAGYALTGTTMVVRVTSPGSLQFPRGLGDGFTLLSCDVANTVGSTTFMRVFSAYHAANRCEWYYLRYASPTKTKLLAYGSIGAAVYWNALGGERLLSSAEQHYSAFTYDATRDKLIHYCGDTDGAALSREEYSPSIAAMPNYSPTRLDIGNLDSGGILKGYWGPKALFARPLCDAEIERAWSRLFERDIGVSGCWGHWLFDNSKTAALNDIYPNYAKEGNMGDAVLSTLGDAQNVPKIWMTR